MQKKEAVTELLLLVSDPAPFTSDMSIKAARTGGPTALDSSQNRPMFSWIILILKLSTLCLRWFHLAASAGISSVIHPQIPSSANCSDLNHITICLYMLALFFFFLHRKLLAAFQLAGYHHLPATTWCEFQACYTYQHHLRFSILPYLLQLACVRTNIWNCLWLGTASQWNPSWAACCPPSSFLPSFSRFMFPMASLASGSWVSTGDL